jgi:hypothetical protein
MALSVKQETTVSSSVNIPDHKDVRLVFKHKRVVLFLLCGVLLASLFDSVNGVGDSVYVRSGDFGQLVTSSTSRWFKGIAKDPLTLKKPNGGAGVICRVYHTSKFIFVTLLPI